MKDNKSNQNLKIDISPEIAEGHYSNMVVITHSATEFIVDFAQLLPGTSSALVRSRIVMNPIHAKRLLSAMQDNLQKYESQFGPIVEPGIEDTAVPFDMLPQGKA